MNKCGLSKKVQIELFFSPICIIFAENRRYLGITAQASLAFLLSICTIFAENRLHLGITAQASLAFRLSICTIFAQTTKNIVSFGK